jgi:NAD(P)-dependent dehydrogenase (short-subunit alcohol dehydrogenase family)
MPKWREADIPTQEGRTAIVTGGNSGIGWHTALGLAKAGAEVVIATRSERRARSAMDAIQSLVPRAGLRFEPLDLASLVSVRAFVERVGRWPKVDLLVNNAGVMFVPDRQLTEDGFERQLGTNYLGPFALTLGLMPALLRSPAPRVTTVSSTAAGGGRKRIQFEDLQWDRAYTHYAAYCQSKLAGLMFALELGQRAATAGLSLVSNACHPGIARTNLQSSGRGRAPGVGMRILLTVIAQEASSAALPSLRAATDPAAGSGSYYGPDGLGGTKGDPIPVRIPPAARDLATRARLWAISEQLTGFEWELASAPTLRVRGDVQHPSRAGLGIGLHSALPVTGTH